ncbi:GntR family transcriptional regulator [Amycolatopsis jiangsuensis]|uniref:GntR family transcriptional regulator n=1 Tax=Amycolatopsis jiangsuensis TaxID=1181879 RepID=A0A840IT20_9PSEU|nr:GntR family transcriptional regulator [Amycolatopsis jiangsuensis]MBB4684124.1 GntR family transcriptional regulator [Amycolatopsis jiangsuensis]
MIEFRIDRRSGVSTYLQIVQQVRQALRLGLLKPGDRLPTTREVVEAIAVNPNTVNKAYRELEHEGLAEGRRGVGTFITASLGSEAGGRETPLRRELAEWMDRALGEGLGVEDIDALYQDVRRDRQS